MNRQNKGRGLLYSHKEYSNGIITKDNLLKSEQEKALLESQSDVKNQDFFYWLFFLLATPFSFKFEVRDDA